MTVGAHNQAPWVVKIGGRLTEDPAGRERRRDEIAGDEVDELVERGEVTQGMIPKLRAAAAAAGRGVAEVRIAGFGGGALEAIQGTRVTAGERELRA